MTMAVGTGGAFGCDRTLLSTKKEKKLRNSIIQLIQNALSNEDSLQM